MFIVFIGFFVSVLLLLHLIALRHAQLRLICMLILGFLLYSCCKKYNTVSRFKNQDRIKGRNILEGYVIFDVGSCVLGAWVVPDSSWHDVQ